jgi:hypothetical protein
MTHLKRVPKPSIHHCLLGVLLVFSLLGLPACTQSNYSSTSGTTTGSGGNSGTSGSGWTVTVTSAQDTLPISVYSTIVTVSSTTITVKVRDSAGTFPPESSVVTVTCANGSLGFQGSDYSRPITSMPVTIIRGEAVLTFYAGTMAGQATINATYQGVTGSVSITIIAPSTP